MSRPSPRSILRARSAAATMVIVLIPWFRVFGGDKRNAYPVKASQRLATRTGLNGDLYGNILASRALSLRDLDLLLTLSDILIDKGRDTAEREQAAADLGALGHRYCLPALLAVLRDRNESKSLRQAVVIALSAIRDKRVVGWLIDVLAESQLHHDLSDQIARQLHKITGRPVGSAIKLDHAAWRSWWKDNRERVVLDRNAAFNSW